MAMTGSSVTQNTAAGGTGGTGSTDGSDGSAQLGGVYKAPKASFKQTTSTISGNTPPP
jgi:hypothetical protein